MERNTTPLPSQDIFCCTFLNLDKQHVFGRIFTQEEDLFVEAVAQGACLYPAATGVLLSQKRPGDATPTLGDIERTRDIIIMLNAVGMDVLDCQIIGETTTRFSQYGLFEN